MCQGLHAAVVGDDNGQRAQKYFDLPLDIDPLGCVIVSFPLNTTPQPPVVP